MRLRRTVFSAIVCAHLLNQWYVAALVTVQFRTSPSASAPSTARDAILASAAGWGAPTGPWSSKVNLAGAQPVAEADSLDALFELLSNSDSDPLHLGRLNDLLT